jgi:VWFA-related protein
MNSRDLWRPVVLALFSATLAAQDVVFRSGTDVVAVDVAVKEGQRVVADLTAQDFEVLDSGERQLVDDVVFGAVPIETTLVVDMSGSVDGPLLRAIQSAVIGVQARLRESDRLNLMRFNHRIAEAPVPVRADLTRLLASPVGQTSLIDAVVAGLIRPRAAGARQLLILFTDGGDSMSFLDESTALAVASRTDTAVFVVAVTDNIARLAHRALFEALTEATGGRFAILGRNGNLSGAFVQALDDFRQSYVLRYTVRGEPRPGWHPVDVRVLRSGRFDVRARRGYVVAAPAPRPNQP